MYVGVVTESNVTRACHQDDTRCYSSLMRVLVHNISVCVFSKTRKYYTNEYYIYLQVVVFAMLYGFQTIFVLKLKL